MFGVHVEIDVYVHILFICANVHTGLCRCLIFKQD